MNKICRHCKLEKGIECFYKKFKHKECRTNLCIECTKIYYKIHNKKLKETKDKSNNKKLWNDYLDENKLFHVLKNCKIHGKLRYREIGLKNVRGKWRAICLQCAADYKYKTHNEERLKEIIIENKSLECTSCHEIKNHKYFSYGAIKNKYPRCKICSTKARLKSTENLSILRHYGIEFSSAKYNELLIKQNFVCAICKNPEKQKHNGKLIKLAVDHCHRSPFKDHRAVRALLCGNCNKGLGCFKDSSENLKIAAVLLDRFYETTS